MTDSITHLKLLARGYDLLAYFFGGLLVISATILFLYYETQRDEDLGPEIFYLLPIIELCIASTVVANMYIKYFGLPPSLTFGFQVGKILPATCEASMPVEGARGLPCSLKRFLEWLGRVGSGDGSWHLDELEEDWRRWMFFSALFGFLGLAWVALGRYARIPAPVEGASKQ